MRPKCPVCGKLFWCDYPNLWRYKRDKKYICSWSCLRKYDGKEAGDMAYRKIKKDGTPAKPTRKTAEWEGGGSSWFYVCPECHVHIKQGTRFCQSCGKEILWK